MSVRHALLGFLAVDPGHGYDLKQSYDRVFAPAKPVQFGQVYSTLARLERDGLVRLAAQESGQGPDRKCYEITDSGRAELDTWLEEPVEPDPQLQSTLYAKTALAVALGRPPGRFLDAQRARHLARMRELTAAKQTDGLPAHLFADLALFHLEADLRWIDATRRRLDHMEAHR